MQYVAVASQEAFLSEFLFAADALKIIAKVLPVFVELYVLLHEEMMYVISKEKAEQLTILEWQDEIQKSLSKVDSRQLRRILEKVLGSTCQGFIVTVNLICCLFYQSIAPKICHSS